MRRVLTMGTFDAFHSGHVGLLRKCREIAGRNGKVVVTANTDEFVQRFKGVKTIFTLPERLEVLQSCRYVDEVYPNDGVDQPKLMKDLLGQLAPIPYQAFLVIGEDWANRDYLAQIGLGDDPEFLEREEIALLYVPRSGAISTTAIRKRMS